MKLTELEKIAHSWRDIEDLKWLKKEAGVFSGIGKAVSGAAKGVWEVGKTTALALPALGGLGAILYNRITTPKALAEVADKELLNATLDKEIAVWERYIEDEEARRNNGDTENKKYDRFV